MMRAPGNSATRSRTARRYLLLASLLGVAVLYLALLPRLRQMTAETERLKRQTRAGQKEAVQLAGRRRALDDARARVERDPRDGQARLELATRLSEAGQIDEAARHAQAAADLLPRDPAPLLIRADIDRRARRYVEAVDAYRGALARAPSHQQALTGLALLYVSFGWPREAEALLEPAIRAAPQNPYLKVTLAAAYSQHESYGDAEKLLIEVRRLVPEDVSLWSPLANLYMAMRRERDVVAVAQDVLAQSPGDVAMLNELGQAYYQLHEIPQAQAALRQVLDKDPENVPAHYYLALCARSLHQPDAAIRELESVLRRDPGYEQTRLFLGRLYLASNRTAEGRQLLAAFQSEQTHALARSRAMLRVANQPRDADAHRRLARLYREQGDRPHMRVELRKVLELAPADAEARRMLEESDPKDR
jgi:tetratricopeptide (TPR) repeat protein